MTLYCNKCGIDEDECPGGLREWRGMNVCTLCLHQTPSYVAVLEQDLNAERGRRQGTEVICDDLIQTICDAAPIWTPSEATPREALDCIIQERDYLHDVVATERRAKEQAEERARVAEGRLRTLDRLCFCHKLSPFANIEAAADAWAAAHPETEVGP